MSVKDSSAWFFVSALMLGLGGFLLAIVTYFDNFGEASPLDPNDPFFGIALIGVIIYLFGMVLLALSNIVKKLEKLCV